MSAPRVNVLKIENRNILTMGENTALKEGSQKILPWKYFREVWIWHSLIAILNTHHIRTLQLLSLAL